MNHNPYSSPLLPDTVFHVYNHGNASEDLFLEDENYRFFLEKYRKHIDPVADTYAWCLMPNHFHLLIRVKSAEELLLTFPKFKTLEKLREANPVSKSFSNLFSSYTQSFNKVYKRRGSLFLKNFKRKHIATEIYLRQMILYIHLNPVKHGFTSNAVNWKWSSIHSFQTGQAELLRQLFGNQTDYEKALAFKGDLFKGEKSLPEWSMQDLSKP